MKYSRGYFDIWVAEDGDEAKTPPRHRQDTAKKNAADSDWISLYRKNHLTCRSKRKKKCSKSGYTFFTGHLCVASVSACEGGLVPSVQNCDFFCTTFCCLGDGPQHLRDSASIVMIFQVILSYLNV